MSSNTQSRRVDAMGSTANAPSNNYRLVNNRGRDLLDIVWRQEHFIRMKSVLIQGMK